tara:strand:+ start:584 stop:871 length:288 start_codon:yes stop_codon:yes gene_type:complete
MIAAMIGWGGFTWKRAEEALTQARAAADKVDQVELKMAEEYLTKREFEMSMDRLFRTLGEMNTDMKYISARVDYHIQEQVVESDELRKRLRKYGE